MLIDCLDAWQHTPKHGYVFDLKNPQYIYMLGIRRDFYKLALMDLFGFMVVEHPRRPVMPWGPATVEHVPFGDAILTLLASRFLPNWYQDAAMEDEAGEEGGTAVPRFGAWQPLFQPYFPEWRRNLELPTPVPHQGTFIFRVSHGKSVWRLIAMPSDSTLDSLASSILDSIDFDNDHLYEFIYRDRLGATISAHHHYMDEGPWTDDVSIGSLPLEPGQSMIFHYDFGDDWRFDVKLERIEPPGARIKAPGSWRNTASRRSNTRAAIGNRAQARRSSGSVQRGDPDLQVHAVADLLQPGLPTLAG